MTKPCKYMYLFLYLNYKNAFKFIFLKFIEKHLNCKAWEKHECLLCSLVALSYYNLSVDTTWVLVWIAVFRVSHWQVRSVTFWACRRRGRQIFLSKEILQISCWKSYWIVTYNANFAKLIQHSFFNLNPKCKLNPLAICIS